MDIPGALKIAKRAALVSVILLASAFVTVLVIENQEPTVIGMWLYDSHELPLVVWLAVSFLLGILVASSMALYLHLRHANRNAGGRYPEPEQPIEDA